ncbi:diaminopimelate epimerase [Thiomicrorhabdus lithotrophica]|uniref:Diaminopimelate epimerase n=1 Tax=Thiomicrorhabdus lithotrophica TaxID=2949997 RepID=A0ABY8CE92_9GAMM|nr:diaminopimelate epimerase [Thiomicrorhabdus lithotrophica]WEJ63112.1 diaminopimelate epimerase [Thiomicrorhabdus lithotrophica]
MSVQSVETHPASQTVKFTKMQGLGNDFMVIDCINQSVEFTTEKIRQWSDRNFGIGFDQLLVVENASQESVDFRYRIFNADGSEVQQCGNGARCFARYVYDKGLTDKTEIYVETASGVIVLYIEDSGLVRVNMGAPNFEPSSLPFLAPARQEEYALNVLGETLLIGAVSMGNPHAVLPVDDIKTAPVEKFGAAVESHASFPERVNVGFAQKVDNSHIRLRVYERGAAETLACGTGACAAMAVFRLWQQVGDKVTVSLPGGDLLVEWNGQADSPVWMSGPAITVFEGEI